MPAGQIKRQLKFFCQKQHWFQSQFTFEGHLTPSLFILLYKQNNSKESPKYHSNFQQKKSHLRTLGLKCVFMFHFTQMCLSKIIKETFSF